MFEIKNLDWNDVLEKIKSFATSEHGRETIAALSPLKTQELALKSFYEIESAAQIILSGIRPHMESLDLYEIWSTRLKKKAILKTIELKDIRHFCLETIALKEILKEQNTEWATSCSELIMNADEPLSAIDHLMTPTGEIRMDASEKLYSLFKEKESLSRQIHNYMDKLVHEHKIEHMLQDKYVTTREGRWVIPVKGGMQHFVPGITHGSSQTKQTVFIEPEAIVPMNNRMREIEVQIDDEIERLLFEISNYLSGQYPHFEKSKEVLSNCDVQFSKAQLACFLEAQPCQFSEDQIFLKELAHPILKLLGKKTVTNTVSLSSEKSILILSGPNAGGKTILLKSIGLASQMARCGLLICCDPGSIMPFFTNIVTGIGDAQSVDEDLSTFAAHLKILDQASHLKGFQNLILIDEICGSTDPEEGSALARAFIERYATNKVFAVITSHLSPLKLGWDDAGPVLNGSLEYDAKTGKPTYQFLSGIAGDSLALQTARRIGVSAEILAAAIENLSPAAKAKQNQQSEFENLKKDIHLLQENLKKQIKTAEKIQTDYESKLIEFENEKQKKLALALKKAGEKVDDAIATVKASDLLNKHRQLQEIKFNLPEIVKAKPIISSTSNPQILSAADFTTSFPPGSKVFVPSLNQDGIVQSKPNAKGEVLVLSQSIRLQMNWSELKPPLKASNPTQSLARKSGSPRVTFLDEDRTMDLRGKTVAEAISELESALDLATNQNEDRIKIIHGHGTEVLKKSIRTYLSRSVYVKKWKAGTADSGGDGITWVELGQL
ncbi:MAG: Smr/MutS family protein [Pseudobdellovibrio sp.]